MEMETPMMPLRISQQSLSRDDSRGDNIFHISKASKDYIFQDALEAFWKTQSVHPSSIMFSSIIFACSNLVALEKGIHN